MVSALKSNAKNNHKIPQNENITIDAKHNEMVHYFNNLQHSIPELKEELRKLIQQYNIKDQHKKNDIEYILYKDNLKEKINELKIKIKSIQNNDEVNKYYLNVGVLLHSYYENIENSKNDHSISENFEENLLNYDNEEDDFSDVEENEVSDEEDIQLVKKEKKDKNILTFFTLSHGVQQNDAWNYGTTEKSGIITKERLETLEEKEVTKISELNKEIDNNVGNSINTDKKKKSDNTYTSMKISDFVKQEATYKKKNVLDEYLQKIDPNYVTKIKVDVNIFKCSECKNEMTLFHSDGIQICENCGNQENVLIESDKPSFKDPPIEVCYFSYRRINHYNELTKTILFIKKIVMYILCF